MEKLTEAYTGRSGGREASLGDFSPQILVLLGKRPRSRIWAIGYLRSPTSHQDCTSEVVGSMNLRESFALAWLLVLRSLSASWVQAKVYFRARYRNMPGLRRRQDQRVT